MQALSRHTHGSVVPRVPAPSGRASATCSCARAPAWRQWCDRDGVCGWVRGSAGAGPRVQLGSWSPVSCGDSVGAGSGAGVGLVGGMRPVDVATDPLLAGLELSACSWALAAPREHSRAPALSSRGNTAAAPRPAGAAGWSPLSHAMCGYLHLTHCCLQSSGGCW